MGKKHNVFTNGRSNIHKGSDDTATGFPDVCKTPVGTAVVPIPYPNVSKSSTLKKGSKSVKINGQPVALEDSYLASSRGDEAGTLGGVISGIKGDKTHFNSYSFDVKIEGKCVVRHADLTSHNNRNTVGMILGSSAPIGDPFADVPEKCPYCGKSEHDFAKKPGSSIGDSQELRKNIIPNIEDHRWYTKPNSLQAHHLICVEELQKDDWPLWCDQFGYEINHKNNGAIFPYFMDLACQLYVALHRSNHGAGKTDGVSYPRKVRLYLKEIAEDIKAGKYCDNPRALIDDLDDLSEFILAKINTFDWIITADGKNYKINCNGCAGVTSVTVKPDQLCPHNRKHGLARKGETTVLPKNTLPLEIGT